MASVAVLMHLHLLQLHLDQCLDTLYKKQTISMYEHKYEAKNMYFQLMHYVLLFFVNAGLALVTAVSEINRRGADDGPLGTFIGDGPSGTVNASTFVTAPLKHPSKSALEF